MNLARSSARCLPLLSAVAVWVAVPTPAFAYAGLGPMLPMIGNGIVLLFAFFVTFLGVLAYPIKMMLGKRSSKKKKS